MPLSGNIPEFYGRIKEITEITEENCLNGDNGVNLQYWDIST